MSKIKVQLNRISQGLNLKDKLVLSFVLPLGRFFNVNDWKINVTIKNPEGIFKCETVRHFKGYRTDREEQLKPYFKLRDGDVFVDVGANIGRYSIMVASKNKKSSVLAVEPDGELIPIFKKNLKLNNINNVRIVQKIAYSKVTRKKLYLNNYNRAQNTIYKEEIEGQDKYLKNKKGHRDIKIDEVFVKTVTLDSISKDLGKIGLMKLDIQGAELDALKGAKRILSKDKPNIVFEAWDQSYFVRIEAFLKEYGYSIDKIDDTDYYAYPDNS